jgi:transcriptional regulator with XRE-family HTH domain
MPLGKKLAELRKKSNMTQSELGDILNISAQAISKWENGASEPDIATLRKLSEIYGVSIAEIINPSNDDNEKPAPAPEKKSVLCDVRITEMPSDKKITTINYLMNMLGISLIEAKGMVDILPCTVTGNEDAERAEKIASYLRAAGATVTVEAASGASSPRTVLSLNIPTPPKETHDMRKRFITANLTAAIPAIALMVLLLANSATFGDVMLAICLGICTYTLIFSLWYPTLTRKLTAPMRALSFEGLFGGIGSALLFVLMLPWLLVVAVISPIDYALSIKTRIRRMIDEDDDDDIFTDDYIASL